MYSNHVIAMYLWDSICSLLKHAYVDMYLTLRVVRSKTVAGQYIIYIALQPVQYLDIAWEVTFAYPLTYSVICTLL